MAERDLRQLLVHRHKLVRMRAQIKNQLQPLALNQGYQKKRQLGTKSGRELLEVESTPPRVIRGKGRAAWLSANSNTKSKINPFLLRGKAQAQPRRQCQGVVSPFSS